MDESNEDEMDESGEDEMDESGEDEFDDSEAQSAIEEMIQEGFMD